MIHPPNSFEGLPRRTSGFDFLIGDWRVANRRLEAPLSGRDQWYDTHAIASATTLQNGAISVDEMWFPELGFAGSSIRVHSALDDSWTIHWVNSNTGHLQAPVTGAWSADGDTFEATGPDEYDGAPILARYLWHSIEPGSATWEQAFSVDDGATWETNWVMSWRRA
jgi:hypothetical protein